MKRYKIVEKDCYFALYERNKEFILGLKLLPFSIVLTVAFLVTNNEFTYLLFMVNTILTGFNFTLLAYFPYSFKQSFSSAEDLHNYIAELQLKESKPKVYYLE